MKLSNIHITLGEVRKERGISQKDIAEMLNVEQASISMYENGKRGIPLDILDEWLAMLEIDVKITPKGYEPAKPEEDTKSDLESFNQLKRRRNYLMAELRAMQAEKMMQDPVLGQCKEEGELRFWPYSYTADPLVGLIETRYDHPQQKFLAVEYTKDEVNVYKGFVADEVSGEVSESEWHKVNRLYFTEDDFLSFGTAWGQGDLDLRKVTLLRKNESIPDGVEIVEAEGFSLHSLMDIQEHFLRYDGILEEVMRQEEFIRMDDEIEEVYHSLAEISLSNRLGNASYNPRFEYWTDGDREAIDVPLWAPERSWEWVEEGVRWTEEFYESPEIRVMAGDEIPHDHLQALCNEDGSRVIGLIGEEKKPAIFKNRPGRGEAIYRVETALEELSGKERADYEAILNSTQMLEEIRWED